MAILLWVLSLSERVGCYLKFLVKKFRTDVGDRRPGDQYGRDESKHTESGNDENQVVTFYTLHKAALSFHDVLLSFRLWDVPYS